MVPNLHPGNPHWHAPRWNSWSSSGGYQPGTRFYKCQAPGKCHSWSGFGYHRTEKRRSAPVNNFVPKCPWYFGIPPRFYRWRSRSCLYYINRKTNLAPKHSMPLQVIEKIWAPGNQIPRFTKYPRHSFAGGRCTFRGRSRTSWTLSNLVDARHVFPRHSIIINRSGRSIWGDLRISEILLIFCV